MSYKYPQLLSWPLKMAPSCAVCGSTACRRKLYDPTSATELVQLKQLAIWVGYSVRGKNSILPAESDQRSFLCSKCFGLLHRVAKMSKYLAELEDSLNKTADSLGITRQFPRSSKF